MENAAKKVETFFSGGPGTTGREPFEHSTATGPGAQFASGGTATGAGAGGASNEGVAPSQTTPSGQYGSVSNVGGDGQHHGVHAHHSHDNNGHIAGAGAGAAGTGLAATAADRAATGQGPATTPATGAPGGSATDAATRAAAANDQSATSANDRVGALGQGSHLYESTGASGPMTSGAAGTDRFDAKESTAGGAAGAGGPGYAGYDQQDTTQRAEGKSSGGIAGVLGTSDKDFTGRDRLGTGAYADDKGPFSSNTSGPGGNTALTGREGDVSKNPVAQAKGTADQAKTGAGAGAATGAGVAGNDGHDTGSPQKKKFLDKVKDALT